MQHYGVNDYYPARRTLARATVNGTVQTGYRRAVAIPAGGDRILVRPTSPDASSA